MVPGFDFVAVVVPPDPADGAQSSSPWEPAGHDFSRRLLEVLESDFSIRGVRVLGLGFGLPLSHFARRQWMKVEEFFHDSSRRPSRGKTLRVRGEAREPKKYVVANPERENFSFFLPKPRFITHL